MDNDGIVHEFARNMDYIGYVWPNEGQVYEFASQFMILFRVGKHMSYFTSEF